MPAIPLILVGAGGHCRSCIDVVERTERYEIAGIVDADPGLRGGDVLGHAIVGTDDALPELRNDVAHALVTVGQIRSATARVALHRRLGELGFTLPTIVSPAALVSRHATLGAGTIVMHHAVVNAGARVGANCILNTKALIEHDADIGDHGHVSTAAVVNGGATVGRRSFIGSNATVVHGVTLPDDAFVRAGLLVRSRRDAQSMQHA